MPRLYHQPSTHTCKTCTAPAHSQESHTIRMDRAGWDRQQRWKWERVPGAHVTVDIHLRHPQFSTRFVWINKDSEGPEPRTGDGDGGELHDASLYTNYLREEGPLLLWPSFKRRIVIHRHRLDKYPHLPLFFDSIGLLALFLIIFDASNLQGPY